MIILSEGKGIKRLNLIKNGSLLYSTRLGAKITIQCITQKIVIETGLGTFGKLGFAREQ